MGIIQAREQAQITKEFEKLKDPVKLLMFSQEFECEYCSVTRDLLAEVAGLSPKLTLEVRDFVADAKLAEQYSVDKIPATLVIGSKDYGIRFYGIPAGYEFGSLIESIIDVSKGDPGLGAGVLGLLAKVDRPTRMEVMVTPT